MKSGFAAGILVALLLTAAAVAAEERAIIVLDASGSMWGQIDGTPKISIARQVLGDVLGQVPRETSIGLMAYGHREKGNCADIELLIGPAPAAAAEIVGTANELNPKGKTPLSDAVRQAAEALKYSESKSTVILITDGLETCNADPCAVARELESTGVDFTAHVVGFGLSAEEGRQVACIADETGGKYIPAENAEALIDALSETVAEVAASPPPPPVAEAPAEAASLPEASLEAPDTVEIGQTFLVSWEGPGAEHDQIHLFDPSANNGEGKDVRNRRIVTADGFDQKQVRLVAPVTPGAYQLHYRYGRERAVIATRPIEVVEAQVSLSAPAAADIGSTVIVDWVGPGAVRDSIELFDPAAKQGEGALVSSKRVRNEDFENRKVRIIVPTEPGFYRLRYFNGDDRKVLATREIEVLAADVSLAAPDKVDMGRAFTVSWVGPGAARDSVELFDPAGNNGNGKLIASQRIRNGDFDNRTVELTAPTEAGQYQLRYFNGDSRAVLAMRAVEVVATEVSVSGPATVDFGRTFEVGWVGPGDNRDSIEIFDPAGNNGNGRVAYSKRVTNDDYDKRIVRLIAPAKAGDYQIRYWSGDSRSVLATRPVSIVETEVTIDAPEKVAAGESFTVAWVGPGAARDSIDVVSADAVEGRAIVAARLTNGDYDGQTVKLKAPKEPGNYVLRYWNADSDVALATRPVAVE
jgi:Ca-activated chloride channel family protein